MTFDPTLTTARATSAIIMLEHHIRQARGAGDYECAKALWVKIESLSAHARRAAKSVRKDLDCKASENSF